MRKEIIRNFVFLAITGLFLLAILMLVVMPKTRAWLLENKHVDVDSNLIYAINQGYGDDLVSLNNLSRIYQSSDETVTQVTFIPGEQVYYTFVFKVAASDYIASKADYHANLVIRGEARETATATSGDYLSFLHDCTVLEDSCLFAVLQRGETGSGEDTIIYYDIVKYHNNNGTYTISADGEVSAFSSETTGAVISNDAVASFCPGKTTSSIGAEFDVTIPIVPISNDLLYHEAGNDYIFFMLYVQITYIDTGINQNEQMDSTLTINGSSLLCKN